MGGYRYQAESIDVDQDGDVDLFVTYTGDLGGSTTTGKGTRLGGALFRNTHLPPHRRSNPNQQRSHTPTATDDA